MAETGVKLLGLSDALPCPFCGNKTIRIEQGSTFRWRRAVCASCEASAGEARIQTAGPGLKLAEERAAHLAILEWNTRV